MRHTAPERRRAKGEREIKEGRGEKEGNADRCERNRTKERGLEMGDGEGRNEREMSEEIE